MGVHARGNAAARRQSLDVSPRAGGDDGQAVGRQAAQHRLSVVFRRDYLTFTTVAVIRYSIVTFAPTFKLPLTFVTASRAISHLSFPFCTTIASERISRTGPVT